MDSPDDETTQNTVGSGDALRRCNKCFKPQTAGVSLRKCGGCSTVVYCSLECQKVQWPRHKPLCRAGTPAHDAAVARYGYPSLATFSQDLQDFLDANEWALRMIITLQRQLQRDANPDVPFSQLPMLLRFSLRVQAIWSSSTHKHRSPATRFGVVSQTFHDLDAYARNETRMWAQTAVLRDEAHRAFIHKYPQYIGQLFVVQYEVPGTNHFQFEFYPLQTPLAPTPGTVEQRRLILEDMMGFCTRSINDGFPLRTNTSEEVMFPVNLEACPGTFVRSGGCWTWKAILDDWKSYIPGQHRRLDLAVAAVKMRMPIQLLILTSLWITCCVSVVVPQDIFDEGRSAVFLDVLLPIQAYIDLRDSVNLQRMLTGIRYD
ncbi:hypothetical protein OH76DRAFT_131183 [Lentinus brumalis]|uniref:MYND-type domain-containing protein n=1 Tax=Lentinus brumalis TaxID=2498619 RepID=A0A371DJZ9_9APHY|nr:hypothetical protein OH76DRAFT_131183 [Polyporus brumalis]